MHTLELCIVAGALSLLAACTTASVTPTPGAQAANLPTLAPKSPNEVIVTEGDILDRPYVAIGDIHVTVRKAGILAHDPPPERVMLALKEKGARMGADAVVFARYGAVGIGFTWGEREGEGRAVVFTH